MSIPMRKVTDIDAITQPGDFCFRDWEEGGVQGEFLVFRCPGVHSAGRRVCGVKLQPLPATERSHSWAWDGNRAAPTLTPSINCVGCWHGFIRAGVITNA